jgi:hypothetical protein
MANETAEGDFIIRSAGDIIFRLHMTDESIVIYNRHFTVITADISEAKQLHEWLGRKLAEPI